MATTTPCRIVQVPGPQGVPGVSPAAPTDGLNAYSQIDGGTVAVPTYSNTATITLKEPAGSRWMADVQIVYVQAIGYFQVLALPSETEATLLNVGYPGNVNGGGVFFPDSALVTPAGLQGPSGPALADALLKANNLSDLTDTAAARTNLGLGTMAVQDAASVAITGGTIAGITDLAVSDGGTGASTAANARTNLGLGTMATQDANAVAITGGSVAGITDLAVADGGTGASTAAAARTNLGIVTGYGLLGSITAWNVNSATTDTAITMGSARYIIDKVELDNASINLTTATGGLFTAAGGGGTTIAADQALSALTASTKFTDLSLQAIAGTDVFTAGTLYARVGTAQGAAATVNLRIFGWKLD